MPRVFSTSDLEQFTFRTDLIPEISALLKCNDDDIVKVFTVLWHEGSVSKTHPHCLLHLIQEVSGAVAKGETYKLPTDHNLEIIPDV